MENDDTVSMALAELNRRAGVIISLLFRLIPEGKPAVSLKEQVRTLADLGIRPRDIAEILGRTSGHVNKELAGIRKESAAKSKKTS
jgi:hypothetical protein